jgi:Flp pilus assembly pilin Flp
MSVIRRNESRTSCNERTSERTSNLCNPVLPNVLLRLRHGQAGQGMVEYGMIMALIGLIVLTMLVATGHQVVSLYSNITSTLHQAGI